MPRLPFLRRPAAPVTGDRRGVAVVEFALILPVMLLLYFGGVQLQDAIACDRKVSIATRALADLIGQNQSGTISAKEVLDSLNAATQVLVPFASGPSKLRISAIASDDYGRIIVQWSQGLRMTPYRRGQQITAPTSTITPGTYVLLAEVDYAYSPPVRFGNIGPLTLGDQLFMVPRNTDKIDCPDCQ